MVGAYAHDDSDEYAVIDNVDERIEQLKRAIREQEFLLSVLKDQQAEDDDRIQELKDRIKHVSWQLKSNSSGQDERLWARYELNLRRLQDLADEGRVLKKELDYLMDVNMRDLEHELLEETKRLNDLNLSWARKQNVSTGQVTTLDDPAYTEADRIRARAQALVASRINANKELRNYVQTEEERARQRTDSVERLMSELRNLHSSARDIIRFSIPEADAYLDTSSTDHMRQRQMFEKGLYVSEELAQFIDSLDRSTLIVAPEPVRYPTVLTPQQYEYNPSIPTSAPPVPTTQRPRSPRSAVDIKAEAQRRIEQRRQLFMKSQPPSSQQQLLQVSASSRPSSVKSDNHEEKAAQERMRRAEAEARERLQAMHDQRLKARQEAEEKRRQAAEAKQKEMERIRLQEEQKQREAEEARLKQEEERRQKEREEQERRGQELALRQKQEEELRQQRIRQAAEQAAREKRLRQEEIEKRERERQAAALEAEQRRRAWLEAEEEKKRQREQEIARMKAEEEEKKRREQKQKEEEERRRKEQLQREEEERQRLLEEQNQIQIKETAGTSGYGVDIEDEVDFSTIYRVKTLYEYHGVRDDDLTFGEDEIIKAHPHKDSESDWWYGTSLTTNQVGFFPRTYVEVIEEAFRVRALYPFSKTREDDLEFEENDIIVVQPFQDDQGDWWYGTSEESHESGYFPKTYVERINDTPAPAPSSSLSPPPPTSFQHSNESYLSVSEPSRGMSAPNTPVMKKEELTVNKTETTKRRRAASNVGFTGDMPVGRARALSLSESSRPVSPSLVTWASTMDELELATIPAEERRRQEAIYELITTESTYLRDLQLIVNVFYAESSKYLTRDEQDIVFSNIDDLLICNTTLLSDLESRQRDGAGVVGNIGDIFLKHTESLKCYSTYCRNQSFASRFLQDKRDTDQWFNVFLKTAQARPECRALDLSHFLLEPMQRITRYPLLLRKILDATPKRHPDYGVLRSALAKAEEVLQVVNDETRRYENSQKIKELSRILDMEGHGRLDPYGREFVMDGVLYKAKSGRKLHGYLFNDILILAEPLKGLSAEGYLYRLYREPMNVDRVTIRQQSSATLFSSGSNHSDDLAFQIVYGSQVIAVKAPSASQKKQWISQMQHYSALQRQLSPTRTSFH